MKLKRRQHSSLRWVLILILLLMGGSGLILYPSLTFRGVPLPIIVKCLTDEPARRAYFDGDPQALHDRLDTLGVEAEVKAFYRPQIQDEITLDQHVHQIFYDTTGYIGKAYRLDDQNRLVLKHSPTAQFEKWYQLAYQAGVVVGRKQIGGVQYVVSPQGIEAPYKQISAIYPQRFLRQLIKSKQAL